MNERTHSATKIRQSTAMMDCSRVAMGRGKGPPCAARRAFTVIKPGMRKPMSPIVTAICIHSMRRLGSGLLASAPQISNSRPKAAGISDVGAWVPVAK